MRESRERAEPRYGALVLYPHDAILRESTQSARVWTDGAPPATFTVTQRTVCALCDREGISAESAGAVASNVFFEFLTT